MKLLVHAALATLALVLAPAAGGAQSAPARTAWGAPDLQGVWNHGTATPLERPERHVGRHELLEGLDGDGPGERLTAAEIAEVNAAQRSAEGVGARRVVWWPDQRFRGLSQGSMRLVERFTQVGADELRYEVTFEDPKLWTQPWTATLTMPPTDGPMFEYACHERNDGMTALLDIARGEEAAAGGESGLR